MKKIIILSCILLLFVNIEQINSKTTQKPPIGVQGIILRMAYDDAKKIIIQNGQSLEIDFTGAFLKYFTTIKDVKVEINCIFKKSILDAILIKFPSYQFETIKNATVEKWGKPKKIDTQIKQNSLGAKVESLELTWDFPDGAIYLQSIGEKIDEGQLNMTSIEYIKEFNARKNNSPGF